MMIEKITKTTNISINIDHKIAGESERSSSGFRKF
jgi:hypothetical protein